MPESKFKSASLMDRIASDPVTYTDLSDVKEAVLKSNVDESVFRYEFPEASVGSVYSAVSISPCLRTTLLIVKVAGMVTSVSKTPESAVVSTKSEDVVTTAL